MKKQLLPTVLFSLTTVMTLNHAYAMEGGGAGEEEEPKQETTIRDLPPEILLQEIGGYLEKDAPPYVHGLTTILGRKLLEADKPAPLKEFEAKKADLKLKHLIRKILEKNFRGQEIDFDQIKEDAKNAISDGADPNLSVIPGSPYTFLDLLPDSNEVGKFIQWTLNNSTKKLDQTLLDRLLAKTIIGTYTADTKDTVKSLLNAGADVNNPTAFRVQSTLGLLLGSPIPSEDVLELVNVFISKGMKPAHLLILPPWIRIKTDEEVQAWLKEVEKDGWTPEKIIENFFESLGSLGRVKTTEDDAVIELLKTTIGPRE